MERKFFLIYNEAYQGVFKMEKENNDYVLYRVTARDSQYSLFLAALRTKPFMLLAGISGTGKSRIVRKLAQATVTEELQKKYEKYTGTNWKEDRWTLHKPANFELIQVKPNWHNSMDVVGYLSNIPSPHYVFTPFIEFVSKAWQNPEIPFFLCLDEMNLAPVEEYFAEFLSAIESRSFENKKYLTDPIIKPFNSFKDVQNEKGKTISIQDQMINDLLPKVDPSAEREEMERIIFVSEHFKNVGLTLPENLIIIGTVNMDETTYSFSRKVLDRAMSVEMNDVDYNLFLEDKTDDELKAIVEDFEKDGLLNDLLVKRHIEAKEIVDTMQENAKFVIQYLARINNLLEGTSFKLGYRAANEAIIYVKAAEEFGCRDIKTTLDRFTLMKILSRLEGDEAKLTVLENEKRLTDACLEADELKEDGKITLLTCMKKIIELELVGSDNELQSVKKLNSMIEQLHRDHFVSYWN